MESPAGARPACHRPESAKIAGRLHQPSPVTRNRQRPALELELSITDLSHDGRGVARSEDGKAVFVTGALPGERVKARTTIRKKQFDEAIALDILHASPDRVTPRCTHFGTCGGCALQHLAPEAQIVAKQHTLMENFERIGHVKPERILPPLTSQVWGYRRKARLGVKYVPKKERTLVGFREIDPRFIADISRCEVLVPRVGERIGTLATLVDSLEGKAQIAQIEVAAGDDRIALVFRNLVPLCEPDREKLRSFGQREGFAIFLQPGGNDTAAPLDGTDDGQLHFTLDGGAIDFAFRPLDFVQVNAAMNEAMVAHALALLDPQPTDRVLDLFCGLGNFTLPIARRAGVVVGVEGEANLVHRANENAARNGIANASFHATDLTADLRTQPWVGEGFDKLLLDPPRTGADAAIPQLPLGQVKRIVYVSCHPGSLARDAGILVREHGYALKAAGVMDMFPHTAHVESIALFEKD